MPKTAIFPSFCFTAEEYLRSTEIGSFLYKEFMDDAGPEVEFIKYVANQLRLGRLDVFHQELRPGLVPFKIALLFSNTELILLNKHFVGVEYYMNNWRPTQAQVIDFLKLAMRFGG